MSEIKKLVKKIWKEIEERETHKGHWTYDDILKAKLEGVKEGIEAIKKDIKKISRVEQNLKLGFRKMSEIKKLVERIEKEIENKEEYLIRLPKKSNLQSAYFDTLQDINKLKAQLQFAKKLIKAIKEDVDRKIIELIKERRHKQKIIGINEFLRELKQELNKILDEVIEK